MSYQQQISVGTKGHGEMHHLTEQVASIVTSSGIRTGTVNVFNVGSTAALGTIEFEPGLQHGYMSLRRDKKNRAPTVGVLQIICNCVYHPHFAGSYSLKVVLPALVPEMTYERMSVANGQDAGVGLEVADAGKFGERRV